MTKDEFYAEWLKTFARDIPEEDIGKYVVGAGDYIWHIFSWDLLDKDKYFVGDDAKEAFDKADKEGAVCIDWFEDEKTKPLPKSLYTARAVDEHIETYVVGRDFEWTYIKTHENDWCGPYFLKL